jgi:hypothetical protein
MHESVENLGNIDEEVHLSTNSKSSNKIQQEEKPPRKAASL